MNEDILESVSEEGLKLPKLFSVKRPLQFPKCDSPYATLTQQDLVHAWMHDPDATKDHLHIIVRNKSL